MQRLDGGAVVITGVGRRGQLGEAVALAFGRTGAKLILIDRDEGEARARAGELPASAHPITPLACDLADPEATGRVARAAVDAAGGRIATVVALAGGFAMSDSVADSDVAVLHRQLAMNLTTAYLTTRAFLPALRHTGGAIIYMASEAVLPGARTAGMSAYAAAKSGVVALMRAVAQEEARHHVRANALAPGAIRTSDNLASMGADQPYVERSAVADALLWLASPAASAVTGQVIHLRPAGRSSPGGPPSG